MWNILPLCLTWSCLFGISDSAADSGCKDNFNTQLCMLLKEASYCTMASAKSMMYWLCSYTCDFCVPCTDKCQHGTCSDVDCVCDSGWHGTYCDTTACTQGCVNGVCEGTNNCVCTSGWSGPDCSVAECTTGCTTDQGVCTGPNTCVCNNGYVGTDCSQSWCQVHTSDCVSPYGTCGTDDLTCQCTQTTEWQGDYCNQTWCQAYGSEHTMCKYDGMSPTCEVKLDSGENDAITQTVKDLIIAEHKSYRESVWNGDEQTVVTGGETILKASTQNNRDGTLIWNDNLAKVAQRWVDQCIDGHDGTANRPSEPFYYVGQNYYNSKANYHRDLDWANVIKQWYDEVEIVKEMGLNMTSFEVDEIDAMKVGHFTQLVWMKTKYIGCGFFDSKVNQTAGSSSKWYILHAACNYGEAGNIYGEPIYT